MSVGPLEQAAGETPHARRRAGKHRHFVGRRGQQQLDVGYEPGAGCGLRREAAGRALADGPLHAAAPARVDRLKEAKELATIHACFNPGRRPCEELPSSDTTA